MEKAATLHLLQQPDLSDGFAEMPQHQYQHASDFEVVFTNIRDTYKTEITEQLQAFATFIFPVETQKPTYPKTFDCAAPLHHQIMRDQTRQLSLHVEALGHVLAISNIYSHQLVLRNQILMGHRVVSFVGAPIHNANAELMGSICTVDTKVRNWSNSEVRTLEQLTACIEADLPRGKDEYSTRPDRNEYAGKRDPA